MYYSLANLGMNTLDFLSYLLQVLQVYDIKINLVADTFSNDPLCQIYCHTVFFDFFRQLSGVLAIGAEFYRDKVLHIYLN